MDEQNPLDEKGAGSPVTAVLDSSAVGLPSDEIAATEGTAPVEPAVGAQPAQAAQPAEATQPPPALTAVQLALQTGWTMAVLGAQIPVAPSTGFAELPTAHELPEAARRPLEVSRVRHLLSQLAVLPDLAGSGLQPQIATDACSAGWPSDPLQNLHVQILTALATCQLDLQLAYELGRSLRYTVNPPPPAVGTEPLADALGRQLARARIAKLQEWLATLSCHFPTGTAAIVAASLGRWSEFAAVTVGVSAAGLASSDGTRRAQQAKTDPKPEAAPRPEAAARAKLAGQLGSYLLPQGDTWLMLLTGDRSTGGLLSPEGYVIAAEAALRRTAMIARGVLQHYWIMMLALAAALALTVYLAVNNLGGAARVWTSIGAIAGSLGITARTVASTMTRLASEAERPLFALAKQDAMAWAITTLPPVTLARGEKRQLRRAGVARPSSLARI